MLLLNCQHPDIFKFVTKKQDRTKVTGANVSVMLTDEFMNASKENWDFICKFPIELDLKKIDYDPFESSYNELINRGNGNFTMRIKAKELYDLIIEMAWENAEPGIAFIDKILDYSPDGVYEQYKPIASNPLTNIAA